MRVRTAALAATAVLVLTQCAAPPAAAPPTASTTTTATTPETTTAPAQPSPVPEPAAVHPVTAEELGASWRPGCPVEPAQLRRVELDHLGYDGQLHRGELVVHEDLVAEVVELFDALRAMRFPIEKMHDVTRYPKADDELSMRDNNTSAFNCRGIPGSSSWSWHAYGRAIDVNPLVNPMVRSDGGFEPATAGPYVDRTRTDPGMLHAGDPAVQLFVDRGWAWGGYWRSPLDFQHFERLP